MTDKARTVKLPRRAKEIAKKHGLGDAATFAEGQYQRLRRDGVWKPTRDAAFSLVATSMAWGRYLRALKRFERTYLTECPEQDREVIRRILTREHGEGWENEP